MRTAIPATVLDGKYRLGMRTIYVLPTKQGILFAMLLGVMLSGSINYSNSLGFVLTFLLAGLATVSIFHTHKNLYGLRVSVRPIADVHTGERTWIPVVIENDAAGKRNLKIQVSTRTPSISFRRWYNMLFSRPQTNPAPHSVRVDAEANAFTTAAVPVTALKRGKQQVDELKLSSTFPLGLFVAWSRIPVYHTFIVYPAPAARCPFPQQPVYTKQSGDKGRGSDDFAGFRNYNRGDHPGHIYWKAAARNQNLVIKQFGGDRSDELWLNWYTLDAMETEQRLSLLTRWVIDAEQQGLGYGLQLPHLSLEPGNGGAHKARCLKALALL
ncbi:MAG: DUF58 domain-containing protein [Gammaproteobacteria bacterium]|nr:DUF58 domain-containing protein [Gammaproteobacteria bacterium]MDH5800241.1 DUF58 domain-containing protein [Gammaproteobacteria bacterium]